MHWLGWLIINLMIKMFTFTSLKSQLFLGGLLLLLVPFILVTLNTTKLFNEFALLSVQNNITQIGETLNIAIAPHAAQQELVELQDYFKELIQSNNQSITYVAIVDANNRVIIRTDQAPEQLNITRASQEDQISSGVVHVMQPVLLKDLSIANLYFGISTKLLVDTSDRIVQDSLKVMLAVALFILLVLSVLLLHLNRRFTTLIEHTQNLANGHYNKRLKVDSNDEIAQLSEHVNILAEAIEDRIEQIESTNKALASLNEELESRVLKRTAELMETNHQLDATLTNLKNTQESLVQSEKLASLGSMVAGVAHELNTPIGNALSVSTSLASKTSRFLQEAELGLKKSTLLSYQSYMKDATDLVERNLQKASELITSFKNVAVDQSSSQWREFDLTKMIVELLFTLKPGYKHYPHHIFFDHQQPLLMKSYPGPIGQVITNLVNNAMMHAFDDGDTGRIYIRIQDTEKDVVLECEDDGKGILPEHLNRIFDPFFTTRLGSGGSGLGLSIVHNITTGLLHGTIEVFSQVNKGTCFKIVLPKMIYPAEESAQ